MLAVRRSIVATLWCSAAVAGGCETLTETGNGPLETIEIGGERFTVEVAADDASRRRGFMGREVIPSDGGMLFIFPNAALRSFWMANCLVDIDIAFLDGQGRVTATHTMKVEAPRGDGESELAYHSRLRGYSSVYLAQFAIEVSAGTLSSLGVKVDDRIDLDLRRLKALAD